MVRSILDALYLVSGYLAGLALLLIFFFMMALSLGRVIGVNVKSGDDFASWCMGAMAFLGLAHTFKSGDMIRVGLLLEALPPVGRRLLDLFCLCVAATFVGAFTWWAWQFVSYSWITGEPSTGVIVIPIWIPQSMMLLGLALLELAILDEIVRILGGRAPSYEKEKPSTPDEIVKRVAEGGGV